MSSKRPISFLLVVLLTAVQVAAWMIALEPRASGAAVPGVSAPLDWLLGVLSEPTLLALAGCTSIVLGVVVGVVGRAPQPLPDAAGLPAAEPAGPH